MNIDKKYLKDAENETAFSLELYKNKITGNIEYRSPNGVIVKVADKNGLDSLESAAASLQATVDALPAAPTTTTVNISSAQILAMGTTPIELLPAPGVGKYYDIEKIILEYTHVTTGYTFTGNPYIKDSGGYFTLNLYDFTSEGANTFVNIKGIKDYWAVGVTVNDFKVGYEILNSSLLLTTDNGGNPTIGNGTLRAIITYTVRTFGA